MNRSKTGVIVLIFVAVAFVVLLMMAGVQKTKKDGAAAQLEADLAAAVADIAQEDYMIYYIGTPPKELVNESVKMTVLSQAEITSDTLPVYTHSLTFTEYDEDGNIVDQEVPRDYPRFMLIYVDKSVILSEAHIELLHNCAVDNHVPVIIEGKDNIELFRNRLLLTVHMYSDDDTMMFTPWNSSQDHVIPAEHLESKGAEFAIDILSAVKQITVDQVRYYNDMMATAPTYTTAEESLAEETQEIETEPAETTLGSFESMVSEYLSTYDGDSEE